MKKQAGTVAVAAAFVIGAMAVNYHPTVSAQDADRKKATWSHGFNLAVRKPNELKTTQETKKIGIEVFKDDNNGNLIYISETGSIAVVPGK